MSENSRIAKNTILLYIRMLAIMAVSLYTSRIILHNLGISDFGLYNVVGGVATMFIFLNSAMSSVTQRYLSIEIGKNNPDKLRKVFNVSLIIHVFIGIIVVLICEVIGNWFVNNKMQIPEGREAAVFWTFQISMVMTFFSMITVPFNALIISRERMGAFAYISIFDVICKLFIAFIIAVFAFDRLIFYSLLVACSHLFILFIYFFYCKINFSESSFRFYRFDSLYKEMLIFASWGLLGHFSSIITTSLQDMMLNSFFMPAVNAARGIAMRVSTAVDQFSHNFQLSVEPQITISYAEGRVGRTFTLIYNSSRFSLYLLWLFSLPIMLCIDEILSIWLIEVPENTSLFVKLVLINNLICSTANALNIAIRANGNIKYLEIFCGLALVLNLPISLFFLYNGYGPHIVFLVSIICNFVAQTIRIYFAKKYLDLSVHVYMSRVFIRPIFIMALSSIVPIIFLFNFVFRSIIIKILVITIISICTVIIVVYLLGLSSEEREMILSLARKTFVKLNKKNVI